MLNKLIHSFLFLVLLSACGIGGGVRVRYNLPSVGEDSAPSDSEYFYVDLDVDRYKSAGELVPYYEISTTTEYGDAEERDSLSNCEIYYEEPEEGELGKKSASDNTLICILDLLEYEFLINELKLVYNFPEGMCDYMRLAVPWHFNHEILPGPVVTKCEKEGTDDEGEATTEEGLSCSSGPGALCDGTCRTEEIEEEEFCPASDTIGETVVRCCNGGKKSDDSEWKPNLQCFGGPSLIADVEGGEKEFHTRLLDKSEEGGLRRSITFPDLVSINGVEKLSNIRTGAVSVNSPFTNYLKIFDREPDKLKDISIASLPDFLRRSPYYDYRPEPFFEFTCIDGAGEILHKILLMIREWNTFEEFRDFYNAGGDDSPDPDVEGAEGSDCDYEEFSSIGGEVEACNDLLDFDDIIDCQDYAWCYIFNQVSRIDATKRAIYPRIKYSEPPATSASE